MEYSRFGKGILSKLIDAVCQSVSDKESTTVLDIGTGNGHVIQRLLSRGFVHLTGIDYSEKSIELARTQIGSHIPFHVIDLTDSNTSSSLGQYDIGIDKGTLDAILLCSSDQRKSKREAYINTVHQHINNLLFLVSCNWTRNELLEFFQSSKFN
jgi:SAM-dependent methyltransferase